MHSSLQLFNQLTSTYLTLYDNCIIHILKPTQITTTMHPYIPTYFIKITVSPIYFFLNSPYSIYCLQIFILKLFIVSLASILHSAAGYIVDIYQPDILVLRDTIVRRNFKPIIRIFFITFFTVTNTQHKFAVQITIRWTTYPTIWLFVKQLSIFIVFLVDA